MWLGRKNDLTDVFFAVDTHRGKRGQALMAPFLLERRIILISVYVEASPHGLEKAIRQLNKKLMKDSFHRKLQTIAKPSERRRMKQAKAEIRRRKKNRKAKDLW